MISSNQAFDTSTSVAAYLFLEACTSFTGRSPLGFALNDVLARMYAWLERVQSEAIMLQIKMKGGTGDENAFEEMLRAELAKNARFWVLVPFGARFS